MCTGGGDKLKLFVEHNTNQELQRRPTTPWCSCGRGWRRSRCRWGGTSFPSTPWPPPELPPRTERHVSLFGKHRGHVGVAVADREWAEGKRSARTLTSVGVGELGAAEEAQVARPGPDCLSVSKTESGVEVIRLENLLAVTAVVTAAVVSAVHPDLQEGHNSVQWERLCCCWKPHLNLLKTTKERKIQTNEQIYFDEVDVQLLGFIHNKLIECHFP